MFKNVLKITFRNMKKHKGYSFINITGLGVGMAACILILLWIQDELSYDRFHENADRLYRVVTEFKQFDEFWPVVSIPVGPALKEDFPEIVNSARCNPCDCLLQRGERRFDESGAYVDPSFFRMFTFPFTRGDSKQAFLNPSSIIITQEMAEKYFGNEDPVGKILRLDNERDVTISGVLRNMPRNSHLRYDFFLPISLHIQRDRDPSHWGRFQLYTYVLIQKNIPYRTVEE